MIIPTGIGNLSAGDPITLTVPPGLTIEPQVSYHVKVVVQNRLVWEKDITAGP